MPVIYRDISGVYNIILRGEGSLRDHDPYGLGLLYAGVASIQLTIAGGPMDNIVRWLCTLLGLNSAYRWGQKTSGFDEILEEHKSS